MAKRRPMRTLVEMERELGYNIDPLNYPDDGLRRFYSDLRPVSNTVFERTKREIEESGKQRVSEDYETISESVLPELGAALSIAHGQDTITVTHRSHSGFYSFTVDIHYDFGFDLSLLFTKDEASRTMAIANAEITQKRLRDEQLRHETTRIVPAAFFERLPREVRDRIYMFALPEREGKVGGVNNLNFAGGVGDPSGFYFPLGDDLTILRVNRQMRQEALPLTYRKMAFHLEDMDNLIKLLIAIGKVGRDNIESLELAWESRADSECKWDESPHYEDHWLTLPTLHVVKCVQLLKQCRGLRFLRLYFESDLVQNISPEVFKADRGIRELCSMRGIERAEIWSLGYEPLEQYGLVKWLKEEMESSGTVGEKEGDCQATL